MTKKNTQTSAIIAMVVFGCAAMAFVDGVVKPAYAVKSAVKIVLFLAIPLVYFLLSKTDGLKKLLVPSKNGLAKALILGSGIFAVIFAAFLILRSLYDFSLIIGLLQDNVGVDRSNFIYVALYISFCNSLLEEFFFRGLAFLMLLEKIGRKWAYIFSSVTFAVYHIAIMTGWFSPMLFLLAMAGLILGGCIFNFIDEKSGSIYCSWAAHACANFALNTIGMLLFNT